MNERMLVFLFWLGCINTTLTEQLPHGDPTELYTVITGWTDTVPAKAALTRQGEHRSDTCDFREPRDGNQLAVEQVFSYNTLLARDK